MNDILSDFAHHIEDNIYGNELIYRSIIVVRNLSECHKLKTILENNDHSVCIYHYNKNVDFNKIEKRVLIVCRTEFESFIIKLDKMSGGLHNSTFNCVAFCYTIDDKHINEMKEQYLMFTKNNINNSIIYNTKNKL